MGRPSRFTQEVAESICAQIMQGKSLRRICEAEEMPDKATICRWLASNKVFCDQYARAREVQAELQADEIMEIADDGSNDFMTVTRGDKEYNVVNHEAINRSRLRVDSRKWVASKLLPKKYGDKIQHDVKVAEFGEWTDEQLRAYVESNTATTGSGSA